VHRNRARRPSKKLAESLRAKAPLCRLVPSQIPRVIEIAGLQIGFGRREVGTAASLRMSAVTSSTKESAISWMKLIFRYSPDATREITSRLVISGSTTASRPRPVVDHYHEILHARLAPGHIACFERSVLFSENRNLIKYKIP